MKKGIAISILVLTLAGGCMPAFAGVSNGGRPVLPGGEIILGGVSNGGRPVLGGGFSTAGQIDPTGGGGEYQDPGFYSGGFYGPSGLLYPYSGYGFGFFGFMDWLFGDLFYMFGTGFFY